MIHYISPYSIDKNIGGAINRAVKQLNPAPDDWIVHMDHDAMFLLPDSKAHLEINLKETEFDILGPVTNRLGGISQVVRGMFDERDILKHIQYAQQVSDLKRGIVVPTVRPLAAFCLCFRVSVWETLGGFMENNLRFDADFCKAAFDHGYVAGTMAGIYVFHVYRLGKDVKDYSHLI